MKKDGSRAPTAGTTLREPSARIAARGRHGPNTKHGAVAA